jgi:hypothetical protein
MRPRDLPHQVIEGLDPDVIRIEGEDPGDLPPGGTRRSCGTITLHHEAPAGLRVRGRVGEDRQLIVLSGDIHDRVRHQVHQPEAPSHAGGCHVADGHRDRSGAGLGEQPLRHEPRQLDAPHRDPPSAQRKGHPPGADRELQHPATPGQLGE